VLAGDNFPDLPHRFVVDCRSEAVSSLGKCDQRVAYLASNRRYHHESRFGLIAARQLRHTILALENKPRVVSCRTNLNKSSQTGVVMLFTMLGQRGMFWTMMRELFVKVCKAAGVAFLLFLLLFAVDLRGSFPGVISSALREITAILLDPGSQWMAFSCLEIYFMAFLFFRFRGNRCFWRAANPNLWFVGALVIMAVLYAIDYALSAQALTLLAGAVLGQGMAFWASLEMQNAKCKMQNCFGVLVVSLLVILLALASVWQTGAGHTYEYHGQMRWSGFWDNPNIFGLLMGAGVVLALGIASWAWRLRTGRFMIVPLCLAAAGLIARGLLHSYSRGAWLGTFCGVTYLLWHWIIRDIPGAAEPQAETNWPLDITVRPAATKGIEPRISRMTRIRDGEFAIRAIREIRGKKCWLPLSVVLSSAVILAFWHFRGTDWHPARRAFSSVNAADFSWRNRIAAWEGTLQITADHPFFGTGWNQPEPLYSHYYLPPKLSEGGAVELNDYLMLGATLGLPALFCFGMYVWLSLKGKSEIRKHPPSPSLRQTGKAEIQETEWLNTVCHAGAMVLLVGFWFDGGLFKLPTAATFWILLEFGAATPPRTHAMTDTSATKSHEDVS
jgi:hypothetical protein